MSTPTRDPDHGYPHRNLHGQIVHTIGRRILRGDIRPGEALQGGGAPAASRTALREAIKVLAAKGLVETRPKTGTRVRPRAAWNLLDPDVLSWQQQGSPREPLLSNLTEVRQIIEPAAAELAAARASAVDVAAIEHAFRQMEAAVDSADAGPDGELEAFVTADTRFHMAILAACRNDLLEQVSRTIYSALVVSFRATSRVPGSARAALPRHRAILDAIRDRHPRRAGQAMRRLVQSTAREIATLPRGSKRSGRRR
jgi:DNA-binding FadR family transcriptional regulator